MKVTAAETQTKIYVYDLMNEAKEHGFKADDQWELGMVTEAEKTRIQRTYHPAIAARIFPELLLQVFQLTKSKLSQPLNSHEMLMDTRSILKDDLKYIVAFNPKRTRS